MTIPAVDSIFNVGGIKQDADPVEDPETQISADHWNVVAANATAMTHTACRAWARVQMNGASAPTLLAHNAVWGNEPGNAPSVSRSALGVYTIDWPANVVDELGESHPVAIYDGIVQMRGNQTIKLHPIFEPQLTPDQVKVYFFTSGDVASDGTSGQTFTVFAY